MLGFLRDKYVRWRIRKTIQPVKNVPLSWDEIERVALILSNRPQVSKHDVDRFITSTGKYVKVFYVEKDARSPSYGDWKCFTGKSVGFAGVPKTAALKDIDGEKYDVVINATPGHDRFAALLSAAVNAGLRCSSSSRYREADLVISAGTTKTVSEYLAEVLRYLRMIRARRL